MKRYWDVLPREAGAVCFQIMHASEHTSHGEGETVRGTMKRHLGELAGRVQGGELTALLPLTAADEGGNLGVEK